MRWAAVPLCRDCWDIRTLGRREPVRVVDADPEKCHECGQPTSDGIYVRGQVPDGAA